MAPVRFSCIIEENKEQGKSMNKKKQYEKLPWYRTIVFKLMCLLLVTLLPTILLFWNLYRTFQEDTIKNVSETTFTRDQQIFDSFYTNIETAEFYAQDLYNEPNLYLLTDMWDTYNAHERTEKISAIQERIEWYRFMEWFISDMKVYLTRNDICIHNSYWEEMREKDYQALETYFEKPEEMVIDHGNVQLYVGSILQGNKREQIRAVCMMTISGYKFQELLKQLCDDGMAKAAILIDGQVLTDNFTDRQCLDTMLEYYKTTGKEQQRETFEIENGKEKYFCSQIGDFNHRIDILISRSYDDVFRKTKESFYLVPVMIIINIIMFALFLFYIRRYIKRPVNVLNDAFRHITDGNDGIQVDAKSNDEFNDLYIGFNEMSQRLSINIRENYLVKINLQREQLKQLQAQINPHFLYNTLLFIKIRIRRGDNEGAERMAGLLSEYFRFLNRNKRDVIPLKEELGCVCTYMNIQSERFSNRFSFVIEPCPKELEEIPVPRLLLQPLAENAMKYGIERVEENGEVRIFFQQCDKKVSVIIEESGVGMTAGEVEEINRRIQSPDEESEVTSTININQRIKLFYGEEYQLRYERTESGALRAIAELDGGKEYAEVESPCSG